MDSNSCCGYSIEGVRLWEKQAEPFNDSASVIVLRRQATAKDWCDKWFPEGSCSVVMSVVQVQTSGSGSMSMKPCEASICDHNNCFSQMTLHYI